MLIIFANGLNDFKSKKSFKILKFVMINSFKAIGNLTKI